MSVEVTEICELGDFLAIEGQWNDLLARGSYDSPFLRHEWFATWWKHFGAYERVTILIIREGERLLFAVPMIETVQGILRLKVLRSMTNAHSFRFQWLAEQGRDDLIGHLWDYLLRRPGWDLLMLTDVPLDVGSHFQMIEHVCNHGGLAGQWHAMQSAYIRPSGTWSDYESKVSKSVRKRLRQQRNRLEREGHVRLEVLTQPNEISEALPEAFEIERRGWKGDRGSAIACDANRLGFYTELGRIAAERGWMRLAFLRVGDHRAAFEYAMEYQNRYYSIKIGYDADKFEKYSAGRLLVMDSLRQCFDNGIEEYDFVGPMTAAHAEWKPDAREIGWLFLYHKSLRGLLHYHFKFSLIPLAKRLLKR